MRIRMIFPLVAAASLLGGCAAVSAVTTVAGAAGTVAGAAVDVTTGVVGTAADTVTGSGEDSQKKKPD